MALYSYACFRSNYRQIGMQRYLEGPGQWICKLSALPRILRVHSKACACELMDYFQDAGFLEYEILDEETEVLRYTISDWKRHCVHLEYNYYSYKGSGFFFFPLPVGRQLVRYSKTRGAVQFSELDAIMDLWLHTILNDETVQDIQTAHNELFLIRQVNYRITEQLKTSYPLVSWLWLVRPDASQLCRGGRFRIRTYNTDPFNYGEVELSDQGRLTITMLQAVPLKDAVAMELAAKDDLTQEDLLERVDVRTWYRDQGEQVLCQMIDDLNTQGHKKLLIKEDGNWWLWQMSTKIRITYASRFLITRI